MTTDDRHQAVEAARLRADLSVQQLWLRYLALGGSGDAFDVEGYLQGLVPLEGFQQDVLAQAVNEALEELYRSLQVPLSAPPTRVEAVDGPLAIVIDQLLARRRASPDGESPSPTGSREGRTSAPDDGPPLPGLG